jgi:sulfate adenylyltransferase subunit 2
VAAEFENPVMMYSIGKDSSVMLHLARKAFYPGKTALPLLHVDTNWKFKEMIKFRDETAKKYGLDLIVHKNPEGLAMDINPFVHGSKQAHRHHEDRGAQAGAQQIRLRCRLWRGPPRRGEVPRQGAGLLLPRQVPPLGSEEPAPELWRVYNSQVNKGESIRVFPLSNWTELDIWQYIYLENIDIVPLYFAGHAPGGGPAAASRSWWMTSACPSARKTK